VAKPRYLATLPLRHFNHNPTAPCMTAWGFIVEKRAYVASITQKST